MQCLKPFTVNTAGGQRHVRCRKCMPCRIRSREEWNARIQLEALGHPTSIFVTLTYEDPKLPMVWQKDHGHSPTLLKRDVTLWMKRLRDRLRPRKIRYFMCGEYGSQTERPHYHAVLFGLSLSDQEAVEKSWGHGFVTCSDLTPKRARYVARYTTKKLIGPSSYPDGRLPEFSLMSRCPPLGKAQGQKIGRVIGQRAGIHTTPQSVNIGGTSIPIDTRLQSWIEEVIREDYSPEQKEILDEVKSFRGSQNAAKATLLSKEIADREEARLQRIARKGADIHDIH